MFTEIMRQKIFSYLSFQDHIKLYENKEFRPYLYINLDVQMDKKYICRGCQMTIGRVIKDYLDDYYGSEDEYLHYLFLYEGDFQLQTEEEKDQWIQDCIQQHLFEFYQTSLYEVLFDERYLHLLSEKNKCHLHNLQLLPFLEKIEKRCVKKYIQMFENH